MKNEIFKTIKEAEDHAGYVVACFWLSATNRILERGGEPVKLSKCSLTLSQDEIDRDIYWPLSKKMETANVATIAFRYAKAKLLYGEFPLVRRYFEVNGDHDSNKLARRLLQNCGQIENQ